LIKIKNPEDDFSGFNQRYPVSMQNYSFEQLIHFVETQNLAIVLSILNKNIDISLNSSKSEAVLIGEELKIQSNKFKLLLEEEKTKRDPKIPFPNISELQDYRNEELQHKIDLNDSHLPNIVCHTIRNANEGLCIDISEDSALIACGFEDSVIRIFEVTTNNDYIELIGHSGAVYCVSISPDTKLLISGSEDTCIRL
jgi:FOG: WD40 repeat